MPSDSELLRRYAEQGDDAAFAELVQRNLGVVFNAALRRVNGNPHLAEEAAQVVFTQLACKARHLVRHSALLGWLHTSTRYAASVIVRREQRHAARQTIAAALEPDTGADPSTDWETLRPLIDEALDRLESQDRQAILLRYFASRSFADIGRELRVSEEASRKRVERAVESLRRHFVRRGVTTSASALALALTNAPAIATPGTLAAAITATATATAAAGAGGSIAAAMIGFMGTTKTSIVVACSLAALATFGTAVVSWSEQLHREQRQLDALWAEAFAIRAGLRHMGREVAATKATGPTQANTVPAAPTANAASDLRAEQLRQGQILAASTVYAPIREQTFRLRAQREFGAFLAARTYPPEKAEQVRQALVRYYEAEEAHRLRLNLGTTDARQYQASLEEERQRLVDNLGPAFSAAEVEDIGRCFAAQRTLPRARVASLNLADAGAPLDRVQELSLAMILADRDSVAKSVTAEARALARTVDPKTGLSRDDRAILDDAATFLSPAQLKLYEGHLRDLHVLSRLYERARAQVASTAGRP